MKFCQLVMGSAGTGKVCVLIEQNRRQRRACQFHHSQFDTRTRFARCAHSQSPHQFHHGAQSTYCQAIQEHCATKGRTVRVANLDPAAEAFKYDVAFGA